MDKGHSHEVKSAKQVCVIEIVCLCGAGVMDDPVRTVTQYWSMNGRLLAEADPVLSHLLVEEDKEE